MKISFGAAGETRTLSPLREPAPPPALLVPWEGLEPSILCRNQLLRLARIPIPPPRHCGQVRLACLPISPPRPLPAIALAAAGHVPTVKRYLTIK